MLNWHRLGSKSPVLVEQRMIIQQFIRSGLTKALISLPLTAQLVACGGGGGTSDALPGSTTITWTAPVARADGSPLSLAEIEGYRVYYGTSEGDYPNSIDIDDGTAVQVALNQLPPGTYYFVMTTCDDAGRESVFSPVLVKTI